LTNTSICPTFGSTNKFSVCKLKKYLNKNLMASIFQNDGKGAWASLHSALVGATGGELQGVIVQPLQIAERADWDTSNPFLNLFREQRIANQVPTWNPIYIPNSGVNIPDEYQAFLDQLNSKVILDSGIPNAERLEEINDARVATQNRLQRNEFTINHQWDRYVANHRGMPPLSRSQWEVDFGFAATRLNLQREVEELLAAYMREVNNSGPDLLEVGRAISALADQRQRTPLPQDEDDARLPADSWQVWYRAGLSDNITSFLNTTNVLDIEIADTSIRTQRFEERWGVNANVSYFGAFGVGGGASNETIKSKSETDTQSIKIHFENIQSFPVDRGTWFKAGMIARFRDRMPTNFWEARGRLNLIPTSVTLVRGVKIEVRTSSEVVDFFFNKRTVGASGGFSIGPWRFGGSANRTTIEQNYNFERSATGITITDNSNRAQILAVTSIRNLDLLSIPPQPLNPLFDSVIDFNNARKLVETSRLDDRTLLHAFAVPMQ
jgi:hypothetical protein